MLLKHVGLMSKMMKAMYMMNVMFLAYGDSQGELRWEYGMQLSHCTKYKLGVVLEHGLYVKFVKTCMFPLVFLVMSVDILNLNGECLSLVVLRIFRCVMKRLMSSLFMSYLGES